MKVLAVSDQALERVYTLSANGQFREVDLLLGCGDLPFPYLEFLVTMTNRPLFYVPGNHDPAIDLRDPGAFANGGTNLDLGTARHNTFLLAGLGGSIRYRPDGANQYTQEQAFLRALRLLPGLWLNQARYGRALDILVSHSPPYGIQDGSDPAHHGLKALNWLIRIARPRYLFHGHLHFTRTNLERSETTLGLTRVINVYPYKIIEVSH